MSFLYPSFLWALGVLAVPVIIHLFNFKRTTRVFFSNTRFLRKVKESTTAKRRLKHYLILLSRLCFLFFLVVTFCQPIIPAREETVNHHNVVIYLDNSQSMSVQDKNKQRSLEKGISFVRSITEVLPADSRYRLITNDFAPFSNTYKSKKEIEELLTQVRHSPVSRSMKEIVNRVRQQTGVQAPEIFYISDFQQSTLGPVDRTLLADSTSHLHLVPVNVDVRSNVFVDTVFLDNPFAAGGEKNVLRVRLRNDGSEAVDQLAVKFMINGIQSGNAAVSIPAGGVSEAGFDLVTNINGMNKARIEFTDFPVVFDNQFFVGLNFGEKIHVLEIRSSNVSTPVEKVFGNASVFQYSGYPVSNVNYGNLKNADLIIVNGLNAIDPALAGALQSSSKSGQTILVIPGSNIDVGSYQRFLPATQITGVGGTGMSELDRPDFANPFFENVFEEKATSLMMPKAQAVIQWRSDRNVILKFKNNTPFLSRISAGGGVYLMSSPLESAYSEFFNHALFVPVMYRIAASSQREGNHLYHTLNESFIDIRIDSVNPAAQLKLVRRGEIIPEQRIVGDHVMMDIPKFTMEEGFYSITSEADTIGVLAFNLDNTESLLKPLPVSEIMSAMDNSDQITIFDSQSTDAFSSEIKERYLGTPLWKYSLILALVFVALEILLIRFLK